VASIAVQGGSAPVTPGFELRIVGTEATLVVRPAAPGGMHITDWTISISAPDGPAVDLPVPGRFRAIPAAVPAGPPRNVAVLYREFARAIANGQPAEPDFGTAVRYHQLLEKIQRASDTGISQDVIG
jgi:predicted dehydrogenase